MKSADVFKRYEIKYVLDKKQLEALKELMKAHCHGDKFGNSTVMNVYFDTDDYLLIRRSIEKPLYKEKLRLRSYGVSDENSVVYAELKKKFKSIVYKRRIEIAYKDAKAAVSGELPFPETQIGQEIAYCFSRYGGLKPKMFLSYEREAFYCNGDESLRLTVDKNILWRDYDLTLQKGAYGTKLLSDDEALLEIKTSGALPMWLVGFLSKNKLYKTSFSKYGNAYKSMTEKNLIGGKNCA